MTDRPLTHTITDVIDAALHEVRKSLGSTVTVERETNQRIHVRVVDGHKTRHIYIRVSQRQEG